MRIAPGIQWYGVSGILPDTCQRCETRNCEVSSSGSWASRTTIGLNFVAVHLVGETSDLFFPVLPSGTGPDDIPARLYTTTELAASLRDAAV